MSSCGLGLGKATSNQNKHNTPRPRALGRVRPLPPSCSGPPPATDSPAASGAMAPSPCAPAANPLVAQALRALRPRAPRTPSGRRHFLAAAAPTWPSAAVRPRHCVALAQNALHHAPLRGLVRRRRAFSRGSASANPFAFAGHVLLVPVGVCERFSTWARSRPTVLACSRRSSRAATCSDPACLARRVVPAFCCRWTLATSCSACRFSPSANRPLSLAASSFAVLVPWLLLAVWSGVVDALVVLLLRSRADASPTCSARRAPHRGDSRGGSWSSDRLFRQHGVRHGCGRFRVTENLRAVVGAQVS